MANGVLNDLISVTLGQNNIIRLYIQFVVDTNIPFVGGASTNRFPNCQTFPFLIQNELNHFDCLGLGSIKLNLVPTSGPLSPALTQYNWHFDRNNAGPNPFQSVANPLPDVPWQEQNMYGNPLTNPAPPILPLIRFYIGDGESLNSDVFGLPSDEKIDPAKATARLNYNFSQDFALVMPDFRFPYRCRTSFFSRTIRAGYLFVDDPKGFQIVFMHELAHVLGLSDRYIEGIDDAAPGHPFRYVGTASRANPPFSNKHINYVLNGRTAGPAIDATYNPQSNLMSSRSYELSPYQRNLILQRGIETDYVDEDVIVLLFDNAACKRTPAAPFSTGGCRFTETGYRSTDVFTNMTTGIEEVTFETASGDVHHNAFFKLPPGSLGVRCQNGSKRVIDYLIKNDGLHSETMKMVFDYFKLP
jgi:hypothetical protein